MAIVEPVFGAAGGRRALGAGLGALPVAPRRPRGRAGRLSPREARVPAAPGKAPSPGSAGGIWGVLGAPPHTHGQWERRPSGVGPPQTVRCRGAGTGLAGANPRLRACRRHPLSPPEPGAPRSPRGSVCLGRRGRGPRKHLRVVARKPLDAGSVPERVYAFRSAGSVPPRATGLCGAV